MRLEGEGLFVVLNGLAVFAEASLGERQVEKCGVVLGVSGYDLREDLFSTAIVLLLERMQAFSFESRVIQEKGNEQEGNQQATPLCLLYRGLWTAGSSFCGLPVKVAHFDSREGKRNEANQDEWPRNDGHRMRENRLACPAANPNMMRVRATTH